MAVSDEAIPPPPETAFDLDDGITERYRWTALGVVLIGTLMVILDTTIVNVALPEIGNSLGVGDGIEWVVTSYLLAVVVSMPASGWMADRYGRKQVFVASLAAFTVASFAAALSPNLPVLIATRVLQGLGGGAIVPVGMAMIFELFPPHRRGTAMGVWGVAAMAAPAIGPVLGGYLVTAISWHWLFLVNVPVGVIGVILAARLLGDHGFRENRKLDSVGLLLGGGGLALFLLGLSEGEGWGWTSPSTTVCIGVGATALISFVAHEGRTRQPLLDLTMFRYPVFRLAMVVIFFSTGAQFTRLVFIPLQLEGLRDFSALKVGMILSPAALAAAVAMPIGGRLTDRIGPRLPVVTGLLAIATSLWLLGHLGTGDSIWYIMAVLSLQSLGMGLSAVPTSVCAMNALPLSRFAQGAAVRSLNSQVAAAIAVAGFAGLLAVRSGDGASVAHQQAAYNSLFLVACVVVLAAAVLAIRLPNTPAGPEQVPEAPPLH